MNTHDTLLNLKNIIIVLKNQLFEEIIPFLDWVLKSIKS